MVSIKDVAVLAGVSDRTVSRVASGETKLISAKTRRKVLKAIEQLGYVPNRAARMTRTGRSQVIGLMTDVVATTPFSTDIVRGIQDALDATPYTLLTINTAGDPAKEARSWQTFREHGIDGALYVTMFHRHLAPAVQLPETPMVLVNCAAPDRPGIPAIVPDDYGGNLALVNHLLDHGHTKLAYITLNPNILAAGLRERAFRDAHAARGLAIREDWVVPGLVGEVFADRFVAFENLTRILNGAVRPTAIVAGNDEIALQCYCAAMQAGLRVPHDISIVGFDDFQAVSNVIQPGLTTMALPYQAMGRRAVDVLLGLLAGNTPSAPLDSQPCELVERLSVKAI
jgi:LacI family transcriptional regulator